MGKDRCPVRKLVSSEGLIWRRCSEDGDREGSGSLIEQSFRNLSLKVAKQGVKEKLLVVAGQPLTSLSGCPGAQAVLPSEVSFG